MSILVIIVGCTTIMIYRRKLHRLTENQAGNKRQYQETTVLFQNNRQPRISSSTSNRHARSLTTAPRSGISRSIPHDRSSSTVGQAYHSSDRVDHSEIEKDQFKRERIIYFSYYFIICFKSKIFVKFEYTSNLFKIFFKLSFYFSSYKILLQIYDIIVKKRVKPVKSYNHICFFLVYKLIFSQYQYHFKIRKVVHNLSSYYKIIIENFLLVNNSQLSI